MGIPDRWLQYENSGVRVPGTNFVAFKTPLKEAICKNLPPSQWWTPESVLVALPGLRLVVSLTNTKRYYNHEEFGARGVDYLRIMCPGRQLPTDDLYRLFADAVKTAMSTMRGDQLVGVHCTHGLNRTGYFICRYMVEMLGMCASEARRAFEQARGHRMEREEYTNDVRRRCRPGCRWCSSSGQRGYRPALHADSALWTRRRPTDR